MTSKTEQVLKKLLRTSKAINGFKWNTFDELETLLIQESQLMMELVMIIGVDLRERNQRFLQ